MTLPRPVEPNEYVSELRSRGLGEAPDFDQRETHGLSPVQMYSTSFAPGRNGMRVLTVQD